MRYERDYFIHYYDTGLNRKATISSMMRYFEDIAILHSEAVNIGLDYYYGNEVVWVLYKWDIKINRYPKFQETVKVRTKACSLKGFQAYRSFDILDSAGNILVTANSMWLFVNTKTKRPTKITEDMFKHYEVDRTKMEELPIGEVRQLQKEDKKKEFYIRYSDIDTNNHVNNITYVDWAIEVIPENILKDYNLKELKVFYKKEIGYGKMISSSVEILNDESNLECVHLISAGGVPLCQLETMWVKEKL